MFRHLSELSEVELITQSNQELDVEIEQSYKTLIAKRIKGTPVAYLTGIKEFWSLELLVTEDTLIPRPETELLVEAALELIDKCSRCRVLDLGTGSGAIALAIASERPEVKLVAADISLKTLAVAQENTKRLGMANVSFICSNWFANIHDQAFDLIISNPPYVCANDHHLNEGDVRFEPKQALVSGVDGLDDLRRIISQAQQYLNSKGWLLVEHGHQHCGLVKQLFEQAGYRQIQQKLDLNAIARVTMGQKSV